MGGGGAWAGAFGNVVIDEFIDDVISPLLIYQCLFVYIMKRALHGGLKLPSINASLSDFTGIFPLQTNQERAIFVSIFSCVDF